MAGQQQQQTAHRHVPLSEITHQGLLRALGAEAETLQKIHVRIQRQLQNLEMEEKLIKQMMRRERYAHSAEELAQYDQQVQEEEQQQQQADRQSQQQQHQENQQPQQQQVASELAALQEAEEQHANTQQQEHSSQQPQHELQAIQNDPPAGQEQVEQQLPSTPQ